MRKIVSYIIDNRDYVTFFITIILSLLILTNNQSENIQNIKSKFGFINYYLNLPNMIFSDLFYLKEKNKLLNEQIVNINLENSKLEHIIVENNRLKSLLEYKDNSNFSLLTSRVINFGISPFSNSVNIDLGSDDNIIPNLPVINVNGVVGKTINSFSKTSTVQLMTDYNFRLSVRLENSGTVGILRYKKDNIFEIWEIPKTTDVSINERIITSGFSDIFPSGIFVGKVVKILEETNFIHKIILVKSLTDFSNLEYVFVIEKNK